MVSLDGGSRMRKVLLGLGFWVQGFRYSPWLAVNFFLKDGLNVEPSTLQLIHNSANLAMVGKPLYGIVSFTSNGNVGNTMLAIDVGGVRNNAIEGLSNHCKICRIMNKLGLGFWVQGFRYSPWLAVNFFLKDGLNVEPSTLQLIHNSANLAMVGKPLYGIVSDSTYIYGQHRVPYIAIGAFLQAVSWLAIVISPSSISIIIASFYLFLSNLGASIAEVANDAIVAEISKQPLPSSTKHSQPSSSRGTLQSFCWIAAAIGAVLGNLLGGIFISWFSPKFVFFIFSLFVALQFFITISVKENSLGLTKIPSVGLRKQFSQLLVALKKPEIAYSISWFAVSIAITPQLTATMFFYQTEYLKVDSSILGISKVFGHATMLLWGIIYNQYLKFLPPRKLIPAIQAMMALLSISDYLFVGGLYREIGLPDSLYVIFSGFVEVLLYFKVLPFNVLIAQLCPLGCEGSLVAFLSSVMAFTIIVSGYFGAALASYVKVTGSDFSGLPLAFLIQAACTVVPIFWSSCIADYVEQINEEEEDHMATRGAI